MEQEDLEARRAEKDIRPAQVRLMAFSVGAIVAKHLLHPALLATIRATFRISVLQVERSPC